MWQLLSSSTLMCILINNACVRLDIEIGCKMSYIEEIFFF